MAAVPTAAISILSDITRTGEVLPRKGQVRRIVKALLPSSRRHCRNRSIDENSDDTSNVERRERDEEAQSSNDPSEGIRRDRNARNPTVTSVSSDSWEEEPSMSCGIEYSAFAPNRGLVLLRGMGGSGKTTTAAIAVTRMDVLQHFFDGVAWIHMGQRQTCYGGGNAPSIPYGAYLSSLTLICRQLGIPSPEFDDLVLLPGDDDSVRIRKMRQCMENARQDMCNLLTGKRVLIVLDDVWHTDDTDWFNFCTHPDSAFRLLITTRMRDFRRDSSIIEMACLEEDEAVEMLFSHSGRSHMGHNDEQLTHARTIVSSCGYLPVAVRAAGRLLQTVSASGKRPSLVELASSISEMNLVGADPERALFGILDRSLLEALHGDSAAIVLKFCFVSFTCVFALDDSERQQWIPVQAVHKLWECLLLDIDRMTFDNPGKSVTVQILDQLEQLGFVDCLYIPGDEQTYYRVHHDLLRQYGTQAMSSWEQQKRLFEGRVRRSAIRKGKLSLKALCQLLHEQLVRSYRRAGGMPLVDDGYVCAHLPRHMMKAELLAVAQETLCDKSFVKRRLASMGNLGGTEAHTKDLEMLLRSLQHTRRDNRRKFSRSTEQEEQFVADATFKVVSSCLRNNLARICKDYDGIGRSFLAMGEFLQRQSLWSEATVMLTEALKVFRQGNINEDEPAVKKVRDRINASSLPQISLLPQDSPNVIRVKYAERLCTMQRRQTGKDTAKDDSSTAPEDEEEDGVPLELSSHPGLAICPLQNQFQLILGAKYVDLCVGPKDSALSAKCGEDCIMRNSDGAIMACHMTFNEGGPVRLVDAVTLKKSFVGRFLGTALIINHDGLISPRDRPDIALGFGNPPLILVPRDSPNRVILKHATDLRENTLPQVGHDPVTDEANVFSLELSSHPGQAVGRMQAQDMKFGRCTMNSLGIGSEEEAIRVAYDGRILACADTGLVLKVHMSKYCAGNRLVIYKDMFKSITRWKGGGNDFAINEEGSLSPMHAPHLAVGAPCLGTTNMLISAEHKAYAEAEAKRKARKNWSVRLKEICFALRNFPPSQK